MTTDRNSDLVIFAMILIVLAGMFGTLYFIFHSSWILFLGAACALAFVFGFSCLDSGTSNGYIFEKMPYDQDDRGWRRFNRAA